MAPVFIVESGRQLIISCFTKLFLFYLVQTGSHVVRTDLILTTEPKLFMNFCSSHLPFCVLGLQVCTTIPILNYLF